MHFDRLNVGDVSQLFKNADLACLEPFVLAAVILFGPGTAAYIIMCGVMAWPFPSPLFPMMAPQAVPVVIAKLATAYWWLMLALALFTAAAWDEVKERINRRRAERKDRCVAPAGAGERSSPLYAIHGESDGAQLGMPAITQSVRREYANTSV